MKSPKDIFNYQLLIGNKVYSYTLLPILVVSYIALVVVAALSHISRIHDLSYVVSDTVAMAFIIILIAFIIYGLPIQNKQNYIFLHLSTIVYVCLFFESISYIVNSESNRLLCNSATYASYITTALFFLALWFFIRTYTKENERNVRSIIYIILVFAYILFLLVDYVRSCFFHKDNWIEIYFAFIALFFCALLTILFICIGRSKLPHQDKINISIYIILPAIALIIGAISYFVKLDYPLESINSIFIPISLYLIFYNILQKDQELMIKQKQELAEMKLNTMILQANPHFVYNTLGSIEYLLKKDPDVAASMLHDFAKYLQSNAANMTSSTMISFNKELDNLKAYLRIEQVRFPNLKVVYDITTTDFMIPCLTVQPIVENAVRHGIGKKPGKTGTVTIRTEEDEDNWIIVVSDDGIGYVAPTKDDDRVHIGISNVTERLKIFCQGKLTITGVPQQGTVVEIKIPKNK